MKTIKTEKMEKQNNEHADHVHKVHVERKKHSLKTNPWIVSTLVLAFLVLLLIFGSVFNITGKGISADKAGENILSFATAQGLDASISNVKEEGNFYLVSLSIDGSDVPVYVTKDGKYFTSSLIPLEEGKENTNTNTNTNSNTNPNTNVQKDIPKSDKPKVELFVMTHCPYGTQSEKGIIPTVEALGSKVDFKVRFVHYFMHGDKEEKETYNQVCIREEQNAKFLPYLECFLASTGSEDDAKKCLDTVKIDKTKLNTCISSGKGKEYYEVDKKLSNDYGVQGSPTLVINGVQANSVRDSSSYLKTICGAFNNAPTTECSKQLSSASPGPGFGTASSPSSGGSAQPEPPKDLVKSDKPVAEAFIFSYCPYGLQFEKAMFDTYDLLKNKVDFKIVAIGAMHGEYEKQETLRQISIEQLYGTDKLFSYLKEFNVNIELGACRGEEACSSKYLPEIYKKLSIDKTKVDNYMKSNAEEIYSEQVARSSKLGISGSPTFVVNGAKVDVARSAESIKQAVCGAFKTAPSECSKTLSSALPGPGFGTASSPASSGSAPSAGGGCGA